MKETHQIVVERVALEEAGAAAQVQSQSTISLCSAGRRHPSSSVKWHWRCHIKVSLVAVGHLAATEAASCAAAQGVRWVSAAPQAPRH